MSRSAESVARHFLWLAASEPEEEGVTHMRLQKLLYYAQGWALAGRGEPLFEGVIEAWQHGPVVRELYPKFADFGRDPIPRREARVDETLSRDDESLVEWVWDAYGRFSASCLREMTHKERPWREARGGLPTDTPSRAEIQPEVMREHFLSVREAACRRLHIDPKRWAESVADARAGRTTPLEFKPRGAAARVAG